MILIYTNKEDVHPTNVIKFLKNEGHSVFRLNTDCLLTDYVFEWCCDSIQSDFLIRNKKSGLEIYGHDVTSIWDRRPRNPETLYIKSVNDEINKYDLQEALGFLNYLRYYTKDIFSIGSIVEDEPASSKMLQLSVARELGMRVPDTVMGNNPTQLRALARKHSYLSLKPIETFSVNIRNRSYAFFSQKVNSVDFINQPDDAFLQTACFVQEYIEKQYELRITIVCDDVVTCKIHSQTQSDSCGKIDWRQGYDTNMRWEIIETPMSIRTFCINFLHKMRINFGCFDFIVTPSNDFVFLECNPNGQWKWIETETGANISQIIAKHLIIGR